MYPLPPFPCKSFISLKTWILKEYKKWIFTLKVKVQSLILRVASIRVKDCKKIKKIEKF